jgi:hypothetical protein
VSRELVFRSPHKHLNKWRAARTVGATPGGWCAEDEAATHDRRAHAGPPPGNLGRRRGAGRGWWASGLGRGGGRRTPVAPGHQATDVRNNEVLASRFGEAGAGGEFDPGSGSTLAACLMHASRTGCPSGRSRGGRVRNTWPTCPPAGGSPRKRGVIPYELGARVGVPSKGPFRRAAGGGGCARLAGWGGHGLPRR